MENKYLILAVASILTGIISEYYPRAAIVSGAFFIIGCVGFEIVRDVKRYL